MRDFINNLILYNIFEVNLINVVSEILSYTYIYLAIYGGLISVNF